LDLDAQSDRVQTALTYAKEHLNTPLSVDALANAACLGPRQFSRLFKEETGQSPARAIERLRVESARLMMEAGRFSAEEIARKNGFGIASGCGVRSSGHSDSRPNNSTGNKRVIPVG
jgi:transcriptional regulator GlxA family with amidase domain